MLLHQLSPHRTFPMTSPHRNSHLIPQIPSSMGPFSAAPTTCCPFLPLLLVLLNVFGPGGAKPNHVRVWISHFHIQRRLAPLEARQGAPPIPEVRTSPFQLTSTPSAWKGCKELSFSFLTPVPILLPPTASFPHHPFPPK